jgi:hypothetical protein
VLLVDGKRSASNVVRTRFERGAAAIAGRSVMKLQDLVCSHRRRAQAVFMDGTPSSGRMTRSGPPAFELPAAVYDVEASRVFTAPTRLADVYTPDCLEIVKPSFRVTLPSSPVRILRSRSSSMKHAGRLSWKRRGFMALLAPVRIDTHYLIDMRYEADRNISHVVTFAAPLALLARERLDRPIMVVVRANTSDLSVQVFDALGIATMRCDRDVEGDFVVGSDGHDRVYEPYYKQLFGAMGPWRHVGDVSWDRIYIARRGTRCVTNDDEIHRMLERRGFRRCYFEDYPVTAQWAIARAAKVVIGVHGAALSSLVFASPGVKVVELFNPGYSVDFFRRIVGLMEGRWCGVFGRIPLDFVRRVEDGGDPSTYHHGSFEMSLAPIERALEWLDVR